MRAIYILLVLSLTGCATYEFDIRQPPEFARHIGRKADESFTRDRLEYRLRSVDNHLVMRIFNTSNSPVQLVGSQSTVVDPTQQSRRLTGGTIAPGAFIKLILPPMLQQRGRAGPGITLGVGGGYSSNGGGGVGVGSTFYDDADRYDITDGGEAWDWDGETDIRLSLKYEQNGKTFTHLFTILRVKV